MKKRLLIFFWLLFISFSCARAQTVETFLKNAIDKQGSGDNKGALEECNKALGQDPSNANIFNVRALANYNLGQYDDAIADYTRTINANKTNAIAYNYRGACQYAKGNWINAIKDFTSAIHLVPKYVSAYNNRGNANLRMEQYPQAIADFTTAINLDPANAVAYNNRAYAKNRLRYFPEAIPDAEKAISLDAKVAAGGFRNLGFAKIGLGLYDEGITYCTKSLSLDFQNARTYNYRGYAYFKLGKYDLALKDDESVTEYEKTDDDVANPFDYHDEAVRLLKTMTPANTQAIAKNAPAKPPVEVPAAAKEIPTAVQKTIAQSESGPANVFVSLVWLAPTTSVANLPDGVLTLTDNNEVDISIQASSNAPLDKSKFHLYINGHDFNDGNKMTIASIKDLNKPAAKKYDYTYTAKVNVGKDKNTIVLNYGDTPSDTLKVLYTPTDINLHVLAIGTHADQLKYPEKDAADFAALFASQKGEHRLFHDVSTAVLQGDDAKAQNMSIKIKEWSTKNTVSAMC